MHHNIFQQILRFSHQIGIQPDMATPRIAATPAGFHLLQKISRDTHTQSLLPFSDQIRHHGMQQGFMPGMHHSSTFEQIATGAHLQGDGLLIHQHTRPG